MHARAIRHGGWKSVCPLLALALLLGVVCPSTVRSQQPPVNKASPDDTLPTREFKQTPPQEAEPPYALYVIGGLFLVAAVVAVVIYKRQAAAKSDEKPKARKAPAAATMGGDTGTAAEPTGGEAGTAAGGEKREGKPAGTGTGAVAEVIGNYRLQRVIASGLASQVYEVVETHSGRHFAMKLLLPEKIADTEARTLLLHEAEVGLKLAHENIIRIVYVNRNPKNPYFVMEFFPAGSLKVRLLQKETAFIREKGQDIVRQAATALAFMNAKGWVHRDVKPDNVLVNAVGSVRVIDFAIARPIKKGGLFSGLFRDRRVQGTRSYMSPEQIRAQPLDGRADIYSFGCLCYEMVTGRTPFRGATAQDLLTKHILEKPVSPAAINPEVTKEFGDLVLHMLAKRREERPKDFHEVLMRLRTMRVFKPAGDKAPRPKGPA